MPTITFSYADFQKLLGRKLGIGRFRELALLYAKAEVDEVNGDEVKVSLDDTNLPYLWCVEGLARLFRGVLGIEGGFPKFSSHDSNYKVIVEPSVRKVRPHIAVFVAEGKGIDDYLLKQLIQLQEKFCEGYGRRRSKVSIGLYSHRSIKFPVHYRAAPPDSVSFRPLDAASSLSLSQVVKRHPKGRQYGWIIEKLGLYPLLVDSNDEVLSLVPIINSSFTGRLVAGDSQLFFEATGTDEEAVNLAANIFSQNLYERGFRISRVAVEDGRKRFETPHGFGEKIALMPSDVDARTGLRLSQGEIKKLLEMARYGVSGNSVSVPDFRRDILHVFDVVEDVAIMYGFDNIDGAPLEGYTIGSPTSMNVFVDTVRELALGLGFQEILSPVLSNRASMEGMMETRNTGLVEIENVMSETYSVVRSWLAPVMLEVLSKNRHRDFPQKIFEQGVVNAREGGKVLDIEKIAFAVSHSTAGFTEAKQCLDAVMSGLGLEYSLSPYDAAALLKGRGARIKVKGKDVGIIGEISPKVLSNWQLGTPVAVMELDLSEIRKLI